MNGDPAAWPAELKVSKDRRRLTVVFTDGVHHTIEAELLRVNSPSAEVQGHGAGQRITVAGKRDVGIMQMQPVGSYAVRIVFDDMHETGIFTWDYLRDLGDHREERWAAYLNELAEKGLGRDTG
ncbi:gamma-butyrobetaine hydroxylase-like domain-containing protein [Pararhizobium mangrovi]|uniref:DUF971 domain-containing protein n=1 Tax=Pararhizobium mangrovi TaxID=2590452 RepID=A0A506UHU8_9HYPH|nr:DUF971 domain-containing protein [Pararhizobium mangrovi]TPW32887.1 DUF971 domain-containing protein [Pararhizobium mangrovi]